MLCSSTMTGSTPVRSRHNPLARRLRDLKSRGPSSDVGLLEGIRLVEEALAAGIEIVEAALSPRLERSERGRALAQALRMRGAAARLVSDDVLESISDVETSQGVLVAARRAAFSEEDALAGIPLLVVAVAVQNPGNLGALLRASEAAGATGAYLTEGCADPFSSKALRGSMGSAFRLPCFRANDVVALIRRIRSMGIETFAAVTVAGRPYDSVDLTRPAAFIFGNEGGGLTPEILTDIDERLFIPMSPEVESLNVAVAAGVMLFEAARQRRSLGRTKAAQFGS
jgi:TrmH family RNA methyltransferase